MHRSLVVAFALVLVLGMTVGSFAKDEGGPLVDHLNQLNAKIEQLQNEVADLETNFGREVDERERLMLQRSFVEGREFFYELHDYRGASEVFYGIVNHPLASSLPNYNAAIFYLADSLFQSGYYPEAKSQYERLIQKGPSDYYAMSLMRLIEIAVVQRNYSEAERLYSIMLSKFPEGEDGSLGRYIIGKSYYERGETAKAIEVFDSISEEGSFHATAQYYAAVLFIKQKNFQEAVNRLRRLKKELKHDVANKKAIFALTHLALARIYYEMNDFPQAMANYSAVPEDYQDYPEALYESIWVFITRNDYLLKAIEDERDSYENILFDFASFREAVDSQDDQESLSEVVAESDKLQADLDEMKGMFDEVDSSLARLQEEAIGSFNKLVQAAPNSPLVADAEILVGNIYSQVEDFKTAEQWFKRLKQKYEDFYASIEAAQPRLTGADYVGVVASASSSLSDGSPMSQASLRGLPEEIAFWLAVDPDVRKIFALYDAANNERQNVGKMREMIGDIEVKLRELEVGGEYPFYREANRRSLQYRSEIESLQVELLNLRNEAGQSPDEAVRNHVQSGVGGQEGVLSNLQSRLGSLNVKIDAKKQERLNYFRQELAVLRQPLDEYDRASNALMASSGGTLATVAAAEMADIERTVAEYVQKADLGIIDVAWRSTRGSSREIRKLQHQMEEELHQLQRSQNPPESAPAPADSEPTNPTPPAPSGGGSGS